MLFCYCHIAPSASPINIGSSLVTSRAFSLIWDPPDYYDQNGVITHYVVRVLETETNSITVHTTTTPTLSLSFLHPAYTYQCSVAAYTVGIGPYSSHFNITTEEEGTFCGIDLKLCYNIFIAPVQSPQSFTGSSLSSTSLDLSWSPPFPEHQNGHIVLYFINVTSLETGSSTYYTTASTYLKVTGLSPYTTYSCIVAAETSVGRGPFTTIFTITTLEDGK